MIHAVPDVGLNPKYLYIHTFGCQMNEYDSLRVKQILASEGYTNTDDITLADVIFLNTCSVREKPEQKVYSFIGRLRRLKLIKPHLKIIVAGCVAQQLGDVLLNKFDYVDIVLGTRAIPSIAGVLRKVQETSLRTSHVPELEDSGTYNDLLHRSPLVPSRVTAPVSIMQGCNNFCTYCIVPYVRGRERSRPSRDIIAEIRLLTEGGAREILLLGQNVNSYGRGLEEKIDFVGLLKLIHSETEVTRIRFTTSHPKDLTDGLIRCFAELPNLCKHLHLPFQSGSDRVLTLMNRGYTSLAYLSKIEQLRDACPDIGLTSDVMVGFPGEREKDFQETLQLIEAVQFDNLFSFRYSDRPYAKSCNFPDKVHEDIKIRRLIELQTMQTGITLRKNEREVGTVREVLVEGSSKTSNGQLTGKTSQSRIVNFEGSNDLTGLIVPVKIETAFSLYLKGHPTPPHGVTETAVKPWVAD